MSYSYVSTLSAVFERNEQGPLTVEEERSSIAAAQLGDSEAKLRLILAYAPALRSGFAHYLRAVEATPNRAEHDDVRQELVLALLEAVQAFNPDTYTRLAAIAPDYITKAVTRLTPGAAQFTVPMRTLSRFFGILRGASGDPAEAERLAPEHSMTAETFRAILVAVRGVESYDAFHADEDGGPLATSGAVTVASPLEDVEDRVLVEAAFRAVDALETKVVRLAYGFDDYDPISDDEVGARLGFSRQKVQRARTAALSKMRYALGVA